MSGPTRLLVTRHAGAVAWCVAHGHWPADVPAAEHLAPEELLELGDEDVLIGVLPLPIIIQAARQGVRVGVLVLPAVRPDQRGQEMSVAEMDAAGARIIWITGIALDALPGGPAGAPHRTALTVTERFADIDKAVMLKVGRYKVTLQKHRATWYYFTTNPQGGGFGSNNCGPQHIALARAIQNIPAGAEYELIINEKSRGIKTRE